MAPKNAANDQALIQDHVIFTVESPPAGEGAGLFQGEPIYLRSILQTFENI